MKNTVEFPVENITPFTVLDYPDKTACILWFAGCNMKCGYCYNPEIVNGKGKISRAKVLDFLESRKGLLEGVVLSGGECTIHPQIIRFAEEITSMGFSLKLDTNGSMPHVLEKMIRRQLIDYVALDFKALSDKFRLVTKSRLFTRFEHSLDLLLHSGIPFEVRTTYHSNYFSSLEIHRMRDWLDRKGYTGKYYVQQFVGDKETLDALPADIKRLSDVDGSFRADGIILRN